MTWAEINKELFEEKTNERFKIQGQAIKHAGEVLTLDMVCEMLNDYAEENEELIEQMETILKLINNIEDCSHDIKLIVGDD